MRIRVELEGLEDLSRKLRATPDQANRAAKRAISKTVRWAEGQGARAIAREHKLAVRGFRERRIFRSLPQGKVLQGSVWFGLNPIKAAYIGRLRQTRKGAYAGQHFFDRAFVATMDSGHRGIYMRRGKKRIPLIEQQVRLSLAEDIVQDIADRTPQRLSDVLRQELNYELNVRGRR